MCDACICDLSEGHQVIQAQASVAQLSRDAIKAFVHLAVTDAIDVESTHERFPYRCGSWMIKSGCSGECEFARGNAGDSTQARDEPIFGASVNRLPTSADNAE